MLIGIDASRANEAQKTGVGNYAYFLIEELKKGKVEWGKGKDGVRFVLYTREPLRGELANLPENWTVKVLRWSPPFGFSRLRSGQVAQGKMRFWTQIRLSWEMLWRAPDVLFVPAHVFPIIHPKRTVMTIHDVAAIKFPKSYNWFERWYSVWSAKYACKKLWRVIVPSNSVKQDLISNIQYPISNCHVVRHGYDERYSDIKILNIQSVLRKYNIKQSYILSIGRLEEKKNTVRIIYAFEKNRLQDTDCRLQLVLVGGDGYGYEKVREAIENSQFKNDIITPGWVSEDDLPALMRGASVFVFPSLSEGFGMPILEAMASGVPVVASGCDPSTSLDSALDKSLRTAAQEVGGEACVYVDPMNVEEIAKKLIEITQNTNNRTQLIKRGFQRVKEFSWEKCAMETMCCLMS